MAELARTVALTPADTVFFPDGRRFDQDNEGLAEALSEYPPSPHVVANAVRRHLALLLDPDWDGGLATWPAKAATSLGDGSWEFGSLQFDGPRVTDAAGAAYLPAPMTLFAREDEGIRAMSAGAIPDFSSDLVGASWFFAGGEERAAEGCALGAVVAEANLRLALSGDAGLTIVDLAETAAVERRIGLTLGLQRAAEPGMLYVAGMRRPLPILRGFAGAAGGFRVDVHGPRTVLELLDNRAPAAAPFGGRGRFAMLDVVASEDKPSVTLSGSGLATIYLASPALIDGTSTLFGAAEFLAIPDTRVVAAAHARPMRFGSWDPSRKRRGPWLWRLPAGAVWRVEIGNDDAAGALETRLKRGGLNDLRSAGGGPDNCRARAVGFGEAIVFRDD